MSKPINPWKLPGYKAGQNVACKVVAAEPGGYAVNIPKDNLPGFLPTEEKLKVGEEILAQFVCVHNNRILLSSRFSSTSVGQFGYVAPTSQVNWGEQLEGAAAPAEAAMGDEAEAAFRVWTETNPRKLHLRRAVDLLMPPVQDAVPNRFKIKDYDLEWLITDLEGGMRTGCVKASSEEQLSRSAMLMYRGRVVGCIYGSKKMNDAHPTEQSLAFMLRDLALPETEVTVYDLPEKVTLAMSSLFMGYPVQRNDEVGSRAYFDYLCNWFAEKKQTACLAINMSGGHGMCLAFVHNGDYIGAFYVEDQTFSEDIGFVQGLLEKDPQASVEASILPPEMTSAAMRFGFNLTMAQKAHL
jgi:hypothetical protein